jgi:hypothetical protein
MDGKRRRSIFPLKVPNLEMPIKILVVNSAEYQDISL